MSTACVAVRNESCWFSCPNRGVSDDARRIAEREREMQVAISESVTVGSLPGSDASGVLRVVPARTLASVP